MLCEIPHWVEVGDKRLELDVNGTVRWLLRPSDGGKAGWAKVPELEARAHAQLGRPAIAAYENPTGKHGHIAAVTRRRPYSSDGTFIAQAGLHNFSYGLLSVGFPGLVPLFFIHA